MRTALIGVRVVSEVRDVRLLLTSLHDIDHYLVEYNGALVTLGMAGGRISENFSYR